jgi:hypothetical protein
MNDTEDRKPRRRMAMAGMLAAGLLAGGILAGANLANAAGSGSSNNSSGSNSTSSSFSSHANQPRMDPATVKHGPGETLLTDGTASKVTAAALKAVPGATVIRVETDSSGAAYEAHLQKADGSYVTVKFDKNLNVTETDDGFGGGPGGPGGHGYGTGASPSNNGTTTG